MLKGRFKPDPNDFIIVIMGPTGSGKTNFINKVTGNPEQRKASSLKSDTQSVTPYPIVRSDLLRIVLVDTPGFDDTYRQDSEILRVIADWLIQKYPDRNMLKIAGIIYLHKISENRMSGSVYRNLQMFGRLCGDIPLPRARLVTTMWDRMRDQAVAIQRETQLRSEFWRMLIDGGASTHRFHNTPDSAMDVVESLLRMKGKGEELLIQEELIDQQKHLNETEAGKVIYNRLQNLLMEQRNILRELAEKANLENDPVLAESLRKECNKVDLQLQKTFEEIKGLKIPLSRRIFLWLLRRKSRAKAIDIGGPVGGSDQLPPSATT